MDEDIEKRLTKLEDEVQRQQRAQEERERKQLKVGVQILGAVVFAMGGWIWSQIGHLFDLGR